MLNFPKCYYCNEPIFHNKGTSVYDFHTKYRVGEGHPDCIRDFLDAIERGRNVDLVEEELCQIKS